MNLPNWIEVAPGVHRHTDSCHVYVIMSPDDPTVGIAIDFGTGDVVDHLAEIGVERLDAVMMTHHHRDQGGGLARAIAAGIRVHVPPTEIDLFARVDEMWQSRTLWNDYNLRQDTFSLTRPVGVEAVREYRVATHAGVDIVAFPTPGHTMGSVTYLVDRADGRLAFSGDLLYEPGKVWSMAATQWSYNGLEGPAMTVLSAHLLQRESPTLLLPSHGEPMDDPDAALGQLAERMNAYVDSRRTEPWNLLDRLDRPYEQLSEHLLVNRTANACSYVLLSDSGAAFVIDYGYDMSTGWPAGTDRAARRPWLASLPALRREFGVTSIEAMVVTHYHDDHVAGCNLLRDVEGTEVWIPSHVAEVLADPLRTDLPCQWFEPIPADRILELGSTVTWREYEITTHDFPGHTIYAAAYSFEVDGLTVMATGDQLTLDGGEFGGLANYQYRNRFRRDDFVDGAELMRRVGPDLILTGHWKARRIDAAYVDKLEGQGRLVSSLHDDLLAEDRPDDDAIARIEPHLGRATGGCPYELTVTVANPAAAAVDARVQVDAPPGWVLEPDDRVVTVAPHATTTFAVSVVPPRTTSRRTPISVTVRSPGAFVDTAAHCLVDVDAEVDAEPLEGTA